MSSRTASCVEPQPAGPRKLSGREIILIVVIILIGGLLALKGMPVVTVLELVTGCGMVATHLVRRAPSAPTA